MSVTIYHNPCCSKSRATMALLEERNVNPDIIEYLKNPPSEAELEQILTMLGKEPEELMRKGEAGYAQFIKGHNLPRKEQIRLMVEHPILIERPIVVSNDKAAIGRPPESVLDIL